MDGETIFVLRIRSNNYYRIELPNDTAEDRAVADKFKAVLSTVAQYEITACPFKRGFYVDLPESPQTPKRPWRPKHSPLSPLSVPPYTGSQEAQRSQEAEPLTELPIDADRMNDGGSPKPTPTEHKVQEEAREDGASQPMQESEPEHVGRLVAAFEVLKGDSSIAEAALDPSQHPEELRPIESVAQEDRVSEPSEARTPVSSASPVRSLVRESWDEPEIALERIEEAATGPKELCAAFEPQADDVKQKSGEDAERVTFETYEAPTQNSTEARTSSSIDISKFRWLDDFDEIETPTAARPVIEHRSVTAPPSAPKDLKAQKYLQKGNDRDLETISIASSIESFESFQSFHSPGTPLDLSPPGSSSPSPASSESAIHVQRSRPHKRGISDLTIRADRDCSPGDMSTPTWHGISPTTPMPFEPASTGEQTHLPASPSTPVRHHLRRRREHSPLPPPANIYIPNARLSGGHVTSAILQKTCSILLGPPVQLVALMLNIAAKFAAGSLTTRTFTYNESGRPIPCSWAENESERGTESDDEDDYGISLGGTPETRRRRAAPQKDGGG